MAERNDNFWLQNQFQLSKVEADWYKETVSKEADGPYSMGSELNGGLEKTVGNRLTIVGPMIDTYLKEIGVFIAGKVSRKSTGLAAPITLLVPWQVMRHITSLCTGYGADVKFVDAKSKTKEKLVVFIEKPETASNESG